MYKDIHAGRNMGSKRQSERIINASTASYPYIDDRYIDDRYNH